MILCKNNFNLVDRIGVTFLTFETDRCFITYAYFVLVERELDHRALVSVVLQENPGARWRLECRHRNCPKR